MREKRATAEKKRVNYYPFGLKHKGYNNNISSLGNSTAQKFGYNGKELNEELGIQWYDFGARNYDAALGRWMNLDPLANKYYNLSPYNYTANNPILFKDPDGRYIDISGLNENHKVAFKKFLGTKEGQRFLMLYGSAGQDVLGFKVEKDGKYSRHTIWYQSKKSQWGTNKGGMTIPYSVSKTGRSTRMPLSKNMTSRLSFLVLIGPGEKDDEALETIAHESFLHVEERSKKFDSLIDKFLSGGYKDTAKNKGTSEAFQFTLDLTELLNSDEETKEEHKFFVNGKSVSYENFVKELGSLFKKHSDKEKEKTKKNENK
ncbi:RHS repeat domain-containing protein [Tenacibaculum sp. C7A-26P2]|uniref:RHS repeat domain-containing protein n=1 Tax=Tenacibaculum sp. C7A-26P2 TaxID=3447504 RepID=UPI003F83D3FF